MSLSNIGVRIGTSAPLWGQNLPLVELVRELGEGEVIRIVGERVFQLSAHLEGGGGKKPQGMDQKGGSSSKGSIV